MPQANPASTPSSRNQLQQREYRALEMFTVIPPGCALFPVLDGRHHPHLRYSEIAVVDLNDCEPQHGEAFVIEWSGGKRAITQVLKNAFGDKGKGAHEPDTWWTSSLGELQQIPGHGLNRIVDGPKYYEGMRSQLIGRVIGIFESIPVKQ